MINFEKTCDLVVIGGGGSGLIAAARAAALGAKVIVLEKTDRLGGTMRHFSEKGPDQKTFGSKWQAERGLPDTTAEYVSRKLDACFWQLDTRLVSNAVRATGQFFDWMCQQVPGFGDQFTPGYCIFETAPSPLGPQRFSTTLEKERTGGAGLLIVTELEKRCRALGVELLFGCRATAIHAEAGRVVGVTARSESGEITVGCRACVLSTGSWIANEAVVDRVCPELNARGIRYACHDAEALTGDGIALAESVGAFVDYDSFCVVAHGPGAVCLCQTLKNMSNSPYAIYVNLKGKRYICEPPQARMSLFDSGFVQLRQPSGLCYKIFDDAALMRTVEDAKANGGMVPGFEYPPKFPDTAEGIYADIDASIAEHNGITFRADSLEELAVQLGVDPAALRETVERYNALCESGADTDFFKERSYLMPLKKPPYYAVFGEFTADGAFGGVAVDPDMRARRADGGVMENGRREARGAQRHVLGLCQRLPGRHQRRSRAERLIIFGGSPPKK